MRKAFFFTKGCFLIYCAKLIFGNTTKIPIKFCSKYAKSLKDYEQEITLEKQFMKIRVANDENKGYEVSNGIHRKESSKIFENISRSQLLESSEWWKI